MLMFNGEETCEWSDDPVQQITLLARGYSTEDNVIHIQGQVFDLESDEETLLAIEQIAISIKDSVIIDISECPYVKRLRHWASVSRSLNLAHRVLDEFADGYEGSLPDDVDTTLTELKDLEPALDWLHQAFRNELRKDGE
jgi:hypothetical protein